MTKASILEGYLTESVVASLANHTLAVRQLARTIVNEHPGLFSGDRDTQIDRCRKMLRDLTGKTAGSVRVRHQLPKSTIEQGLAAIRSYAEPVEDVVLPAGKYLLLSDIHLPYHDPESLRLAIERGVKDNCKAVYLNGDIMDCHTISRFEKDPHSRSFAQECEAVRQFIAVLNQEFKSIYYKEGNHEARYSAYIRQNVPNVAAMLPALPQVLRLEELGVEWVSARQRATMGALSVIHGHEFPGGIAAPVNTARGLFLRAKQSSIQGHNHASSAHRENTIDGTQIGTWSTGCLCDLRPAYMPFAYTKWNHGFAIVEHDGKDFEVHNYQILKGKVKSA